jgi:hypothetical protein
MTAESRIPLSEFEIWFLCRIAQAVEACEVSEALLREVCDAFRTRDAVFLVGHRESAVRRLEELGGMSKAEAEAALEMMQDYPDRLRDRFVCWLAEGWLDGRRRAYGKGRTAQLGES